jgi:hypothetical protein
MPVNEFSVAINNNINLYNELNNFLELRLDIMKNYIILPTPDNNPEEFETLREETSNFLNLNELPNDNNILDHLVGIVEAQIQAYHATIVPDEEGIEDIEDIEDPGPRPA